MTKLMMNYSSPRPLWFQCRGVHAIQGAKAPKPPRTLCSFHWGVASGLWWPAEVQCRPFASPESDAYPIHRTSVHNSNMQTSSADGEDPYHLTSAMDLCSSPSTSSSSSLLLAR